MAFTWIPFYTEFAQKLLQFRSNRKPLVDWIYSNIDGSLIKHFKDAPDGRRVPDTDPFTVMAIINRGITFEKKVELCKRFKTFLSISVPVPQDFSGVPEVNNIQSNFIAFEVDREDGDIERLWNVFECAVLDKDIEKAYDALNGQYLIKYNITMGLFWIRPDKYLALDGINRTKLIFLGLATFDGKFVPYKKYEEIMKRFDAKMQFLERYRNNDSIFVCDKDSESVMNVQTTIAGCTDIVRQALELIACINRTPAVKLLGISPSGFNATGESDLKNYYDYIASKQELYREQIQEILDIIQLVEFDEIDPAITFEFEPLNEENKASQAMTAQTKIGALTQLVDRQAMSAEELREAVKQDQDLGLEFLDEEMPAELKEATQTELMTDDPNSEQGNMFADMMQKQQQSEPAKNSIVDMAQKSFNNSNE